jgi:hypothetical protein
LASSGQIVGEASPGGRPGKVPGLSKACADGKHVFCFKNNCTCTLCGHPPPVTPVKKKADKRNFVVDSILEGLAI